MKSSIPTTQQCDSTRKQQDQSTRTTRTEKWPAIKPTIIMFRFINWSSVNAIPRCFRPSTSCRIHSMQPPYSGPPSYEMVTRRFTSTQVNPQNYFNLKSQRDAKDRGQFVIIQGIARDQKDYNVLISDIKHETLETEIAEELGIPYLSKATESQAKEVVRVAKGYIHGSKFRPIVPFVVGHNGEVRWVFFILDSGAPLTYLSVQGSKLLGIKEGDSTRATIGGYSHLVYMSTPDHHFADINLLGGDFCDAHGVHVTFDYKKGSVKLRFGGVWKVVEQSKL